MNALSRLYRSVRSARSTDPGLGAFYNAVVQRNEVGGPRYDELRRDYQEMQRVSNRYGLS
jgi:hypothetical protein